MKTTSSFDLVIFDCDGVLVNSEPLVNQIYVQMLGEFGFQVDANVKIAQVAEHFGDAIFSATEVPHPKPAPDVYLAAAKALNVSPDRCVVIEDSIPGVTAAIRAGMQVYGHAAFTSSESLRQAGAIPFANMLELQTILSDPNKIAIIQ